ncbi:helix-turn-helix domain-containing protein [Tianweitania sediminis]|uniref:Helix-turn-helix domain-containing protein n=1 Tax=Tianweitania sediminis TaxID=1502156 RepID=A0A8J7R7L9_9HYPH|nr:helix-turn-helix domain-containing protein [Tianweitania sediminis]
MNQLLTPVEAARELGIGLKTLNRARKAGELAYINIGFGTQREAPRFDRADLEAWMEKRRKTLCPSSSEKVTRRASTPTTSGYAVVDFAALRAQRRSEKQKR